MSDKNTIYEITQLMNDRAVIQNDLDEILGIVKDVIYKKYITKFQLALDEQTDIVSKNTPREIKLLDALKPFMEENSHSNIDKMIAMIYKVNTAKNINTEIQKCSAIDKTNNNSDIESTIHADGIYELDNKCAANTRPSNTNITELIFMLLVIGIIK